MAPGKMASQVAHASAQSLLRAVQRRPDLVDQYIESGVSGTRVVLLAPNERVIQDIYDRAQALDLPCALFMDSGHICLPHFTGDLVSTAVAVGPVPRDMVRGLFRKLSLA